MKQRGSPAFAVAGSQKWLQVAIDRDSDLLLSALREADAVASIFSVTWRSPLRADRFREYCDQAELRVAGINELSQALSDSGRLAGRRGTPSARLEGPLFVEAKAHIANAASPGVARIEGVRRDHIAQSGRSAAFVCASSFGLLGQACSTSTRIALHITTFSDM